MATLILFASLAFESVTIRFFEQADGAVLPFERRLHTSRFDATRTRLLGVEITATYAAPEETATIPVACALTKPDGARVDSERPMAFQFFAGRTVSQSANLLWGMPAIERWEPGIYEVECTAGAKTIGAAQFEIALGPADAADGDVRVASLRVFPVEGELPPRSQRKYARSLAADDTTRIGVELEFTHAPLGRTPKIPVDCWFFWPDGQTSPPLVLSYEPQADWAGGYSAGAIGWEQPGNWLKGVYTVTCAIHGRPVAVDRFDVT